MREDLIEFWILIDPVFSLGNSIDAVRYLCGEEVASKCTPIWGLNAEGELQGCWREFGVPGLWYMSGKFNGALFLLDILIYLL